MNKHLERILYGDKPELILLDGNTESEDKKTIIIIPGLFTKRKKPNSGDIRHGSYDSLKYAISLREAGWNGQIHYLWWDSSSIDSVLVDSVKIALSAFVFPSIFFLFQFILYDRSSTLWHETQQPLLTMALMAIAGVMIFLTNKFTRIHKRAKRTANIMFQQSSSKETPHGTLWDSLQGYEISFLTHSMGSYVLRRKFKHEFVLPKSSRIVDIILMGGVIELNERIWSSEKIGYKNIFNLYNTTDPWVKFYERFQIVRRKMPEKLIGTRMCKSSDSRKVENVNTFPINKSHYEYHLAFPKRMRYENGQWYANGVCLE